MTEHHDHDVYDVHGAAKEHHRHHEYATGDQLEQTSARLADLSQVAADLLEKATGRLAELERDRAAIVRRMREFETQADRLESAVGALQNRLVELEDARAQAPDPTRPEGC